MARKTFRNGFLLVGILTGLLGLGLMGCPGLLPVGEEAEEGADTTPTGTPPANQSPTAVMSVTPTSGDAPLTVSFDGTSSSDPDGTIATYSWTFGDGNTGTGATTSHTYLEIGTFTAFLTVTDNDGATATDSEIITVVPIITITFPEDGAVVGTLLTVTGTVSHTMVSYKATIDDSTIVKPRALELTDGSFLVEFDLIRLDDGSHTLTVEGGGASASVTFILDKSTEKPETPW